MQYHQSEGMFNNWLRKKIENLGWLMRWQAHQIHCHRENVSPELINYLHHLHLQPGARILVPLCGKSKDMQWLAEQGYPIVGVELSPIACRNFFDEINIIPHITRQKNFIRFQYNNIELLCGDFFKLTSSDLPPIDAIYDCRALIALPVTIRRQYVLNLLACCEKIVKILLIGFNSTSNIKGPPFSISDDEINHLFGLNFNVQILNRETLTEIPKHLSERGFEEVINNIYLISTLKNII
jgi:thiopurine S-methyltransferase